MNKVCGSRYPQTFLPKYKLIAMFMKGSEELFIKCLSWPTDLLPEIYSTNVPTCEKNDTFMRLVITVLFITIRDKNQPKCPSRG